MSKCCWKNGADRLAPCRVATNLQFVENTVTVKCNKEKHNKTMYACKAPDFWLCAGLPKIKFFYLPCS